MVSRISQRLGRRISQPLASPIGTPLAAVIGSGVPAVLDLDGGQSGVNYSGTLTEGGANSPVASNSSYADGDVAGCVLTFAWVAGGQYLTDRAFETFDVGGDTIDLDTSAIGTTLVGSTSIAWDWDATSGVLLLSKSGGGTIPNSDWVTLYNGLRYGHSGTGGNFTAANRIISHNVDSELATSTISLVDISEPVLGNPGNQSYEQGETITPIAIVNSGGTGIWNVTGLPDGLSGAPSGNNFVISGQVDVAATVQTNNVSVTCVNGGGSPQVDFDISVTAPVPVSLKTLLLTVPAVASLKTLLLTVPAVAPPESWEPTAPTEYAVPAFALPSGAVHSPADSAELTTLLGGGNIGTGVLAAGDVISLDSTVTYTGEFWFPNLGSSDWTYVISDALASLPPSGGRRVNDSDLANMVSVNPKTTSVSFNFQYPAINLAHGALKYRFVGIKSTPPASSDNQLGVFQTGYGAEKNSSFATSVSQLPEDIIIDRCHFEGRDTAGEPDRYGVIWNVRGGAIIQSRIINFTTGDTDGAEANAIFSHSGGYEYYIRNNELSASGENLLFGGTDSAMADPNPHDIVVRDNWIHKPTKWFEASGDWDSYDRKVKNLLECKKAKRIEIYGNHFDGCGEDDDGQFESALVFTVRNQSGSDNDATVEDVYVHDNVIKSVGTGVRFLSNDAGNSESLNRIRIRNNLFYDIGEWTRTGRFVHFVGNYPTIPANHVRFEHNTFVKGPNATLNPFWTINHEGNDDCFDNTLFQHNIFEGTKIGGTGDPGAEASMNKWHVNWNVVDNVNFNYAGTGLPAVEANYDGSSIDQAADPPASPDADDIQFEDYANGDFRLSSACAYAAGNAREASDGTDMGADINALNTATAGAISGDWS